MPGAGRAACAAQGLGSAPEHDCRRHTDVCIPKANCCTNADCSGTTPQCSAGTCVGGVLSITPTTQSFGSVVVGDQSTTSIFVVRNTGAGSTGTLTAVIAGTAEFVITSNGCSGTSLTAGTSCDVSAKFAPTSVGAKAATLQVSGTPGGSISSTLQGTGQAPAALTMNPPTYIFPATITGGSTSVATTFTVTNTGSVAAGTTVGLVASLIGANASEFAISTNTCAASLGPSLTCLVVVAFKPALLSSGAKAATLSVTATPGAQRPPTWPRLPRSAIPARTALCPTGRFASTMSVADPVAAPTALVAAPPIAMPAWPRTPARATATLTRRRPCMSGALSATHRLPATSGRRTARLPPRPACPAPRRPIPIMPATKPLPRPTTIAC